MSSVKTDGIVLRYANWGEGHRMLTLLTPGGLLSVAARGCRKANSKTLSAAELFTAGEYMLAQKGDRYTLTGFHLHESFYPIREDYERLAHGVYWLNLCEAATQPGEDSHRLFKMLLLSLAVLAYGDMPLRGLTAEFLAQFAMLQGFAPLLGRCVRCGAQLAPPMRYSAYLGGACCSHCAGEHGDPLSPQALAWMQEAQQHGAYVLAGRRGLPPGDEAVQSEAFSHLRAHVEQRMEKRIPSGDLL